MQDHNQEYITANYVDQTLITHGSLKSGQGSQIRVRSRYD
jgi:hypothetical protein